MVTGASAGGRRGGITTLDLTDEAERTQIRTLKEKLGKRSFLFAPRFA